jgi:hypothetical protein
MENEKLMPEYHDKLKNYLPETFWITELSIPELFWINQNKVGEIITDPTDFKPPTFDGVSFIRLPNLIGFVAKDEVVIQEIEQDQIHHSLIPPREFS